MNPLQAFADLHQWLIRDVVRQFREFFDDDFERAMRAQEITIDPDADHDWLKTVPIGVVGVAQDVDFDQFWRLWDEDHRDQRNGDG